MLCGRGSAPDPTGEAPSAPCTADLAGFDGHFLAERGKRRIRKARKRRE